MDAVNFFFKEHRVSTGARERRIFEDPGRVLDLYKKSFNKSSHLFAKHQGSTDHGGVYYENGQARSEPEGHQ